MANIKISQLTSLSTMTDAAVIPVVDSGVTQQISGANLKTYFTGSYGNANVVANLAALGSNPISTTGNVTAGNLDAVDLVINSIRSDDSSFVNIDDGVNVTGDIAATGNITAGNISTGIITLTNGAQIRNTAGNAVAFGLNAGQTSQGDRAVAIGLEAGTTLQGVGGVAIGEQAGHISQGVLSVAIGYYAGSNAQSFSAVAIGAQAGETAQGSGAIAIGDLAGRTNQASNSIIINATGANLDQTTANTFTVAPVRNDVANTGEVVFYNATSKEITYGNTISVAGNITAGNLSAGTVLGNSVTLNTSANVSVAAGQMAWNSSDGTMDIGLGYGNVVLQTGQETHYVARNETGTAISNGTAVYCSGVTPSGRVSIDLMTSNISPVQFLGLATQTINNGVNGVVTWFGYVRDLDTRGTANTAISVGDENWAVGDKLYVHPTAPGKLTKVEPAAPNVKICVASIITRNQSSGVLFVRPTTNLTAADLSDVQITTPATNQFLVYVGNRWENTALDISLDTTPALGGNLAGAGFNISNVGNITATNLPTKFAGAWSVPTGNSTQSFTVDSNNTYQMWVEGNIPNGIIAWNALVTVTNNNVPVLGQQFAWNYEGGGNVLMFNTIPDQIIGTAGAISNVEPAVSNTNVFSFGINNASGNTITVEYGWVKLS